MNSDPSTPSALTSLNAAMLAVNRVLLGKSHAVRLAMTCLVARGHLLLEDLPGMGKTVLAHALAKTLGLSFNRVQFTNDLLPGDLTGAAIYVKEKEAFVFHPGPIFTQLLLADEINRASPKTQSAMLETMQERSVTLLGTTRELPRPFFVLASQNPIELEGTYPLPEAQLDRFLFRLRVGDLDVDTVTAILTDRRHGAMPAAAWRMSPETLDACFAAVDRVALPTAVAKWVARLVLATHPDGTEAPARVRACVSYGASPRAAIAMAEAARALALLDGRPSVGFEDVKAVAAPVLNHRLILNYQARLDKVTADSLVQELLDTLDVAAMNLPAGVEVQ